jgi:hypothetical protein
MDPDLALFEDSRDAYAAHRFFGLPPAAQPEALARKVLSLTMTRIEYSTLSKPERAALDVWALALGSVPPEPTGQFSYLTVRDDRVAESARLAARMAMTHDGAPKLAQRLVQGAEGRAPKAVLEEFGRRVYDGTVRVVDRDADDDNSTQTFGPPDDQYSALADRTPDTWFLDD